MLRAFHSVISKKNTMKKIGILGSGQVAKVLAAGFLKHGYEVMMGTRDTAKLNDWLAENKAAVGSFEDAARYADIVVLAVKGNAANSALALAGIENLEDKLVIDTTNPIGDVPPSNGVLNYFTTLDDSLMEQLQRQAPQAHFVKAWNSVGNGLMVNPAIMMRRNHRPPEFWLSLAGKRKTVGRQREQGPSSLFVCCGVFLDFYRTNGCTLLNY
jgi:glutamyl-tRNA reductase